MTPWGSSSSSPAMQRSRPWMRAMPSPTESTVPTSATSTPAREAAELLADDPADLVGANLHAASCLAPPFAAQGRRLSACQPVAHGTVVGAARPSGHEHAPEHVGSTSLVSSMPPGRDRRAPARAPVARAGVEAASAVTASAATTPRPRVPRAGRRNGRRLRRAAADRAPRDQDVQPAADEGLRRPAQDRRHELACGLRRDGAGAERRRSSAWPRASPTAPRSSSRGSAARLALLARPRRGARGAARWSPPARRSLTPRLASRGGHELDDPRGGALRSRGFA